MDFADFIRYNESYNIYTGLERGSAMLAKLKVVQFGNSLGTSFSKEIANKLKVEKGDTLYVTEAPGGWLLTPYDPEFESQMNQARVVMKKRRNALRELAK